MPLGNDVVDLRDARASRKEIDPRFLSRVFSLAEQECIAASSDPALTLWMIWAAKESMYKVAARCNPRAVFAHAKYSLDSASLEKLLNCSGNSVASGDLYWKWNEDYLHCVFGSAQQSCVERVMPSEERLSEDEEHSVHSSESRQVRLIAKKLMGGNAKIIRKWDGERFLAPESPGFELSLSHDGRFVAAVVSSVAQRVPSI